VVVIGVVKLFREMVREDVFQPLIIKEKLLWKLAGFLESSQPLHKTRIGSTDDSLVTGAVIEMLDSLIMKHGNDHYTLTKYIVKGQEEPEIAPNREELVRHILNSSSPYQKPPLKDLLIVERLQKALEKYEQHDEYRSRGNKLSPEDFCVNPDAIKDRDRNAHMREREREDAWLEDDDDEEPAPAPTPKHDYFSDATTLGPSAVAGPAAPAAVTVKIEPPDEATNLAADLAADLDGSSSGDEEPSSKKPRL
jgi:hypothetical protein